MTNTEYTALRTRVILSAALDAASLRDALKNRHIKPAWLHHAAAVKFEVAALRKARAAAAAL